MSILDPNTWYRLSETRVDNSTGPFNLNLQLRDVGLRVHPVTDGTASWQFLPVGDVKGRYLMRLDQAGVKQQLGVCYDSAEIASGNTVACLQASALDASQQWDVSSFGAGTFKFVNVANGTKYVLDVHPSSNLFLSTAIEGSPGVADKQPAQHWVLSSASAVNDAAYSTIYSGVRRARKHILVRTVIHLILHIHNDHLVDTNDATSNGYDDCRRDCFRVEHSDDYGRGRKVF
ncbi:hypothetical protein C8034_v012102 [Colletotrichum sidae]|uniref:Uncharacterized protein n=1 Tax=Colletotrichum sidae TaxID=1347389 RepID=A0A4R8TI79_9PEZI|nr:hypothetical protein C8034_v012102 [Colletotrichum sidae]